MYSDIYFTNELYLHIAMNQLFHFVHTESDSKLKLLFPYNVT